MATAPLTGLQFGDGLIATDEGGGIVRLNVCINCENATTWHNGTGVPDSSLGGNGDYYIDNDTGTVYVKEGGAWSPVYIPPGAMSTDTSCWLPLTTTVAGDDVLVFDADYSLIPTFITF